MTDPELIFIDEPFLTFGYGQKATDPRDGLTLFGPFLKDKIKGLINIGVIGPKKQREYLIDYLKQIHKPILGQKKRNSTPFLSRS